MSSIIEHYERFLGPVECGWGGEALQVVRFLDRPDPGVATYATVGLGRHILRLPSGREVRQEVLTIAHGRFEGGRIASFLLTFVEWLLAQHRALARGEVVGPSAPVIPGVATSAVYAAIPVVFPDDFGVHGEGDEATVIVWAMPILDDEARFILDKGWSEFEDRLENSEVDLFDMQRSSVLEK